jgi:hypothetical protein
VLAFIETRLFTKLADDYLGPDSLFALQLHLLQQPDSGAIIQGSGGVRKLRWARPGSGKRGGLRIIYFLRTELRSGVALDALCQERSGQYYRARAEEDKGGD